MQADQGDNGGLRRERQLEQQQQPEQGGVEHHEGKRPDPAQPIRHPAEDQGAGDAGEGLNGEQRRSQRGGVAPGARHRHHVGGQHDRARGGSHERERHRPEPYRS
jgi:hypothetical protein